MIQAQTADGVIHQFPDGTSPDVIDRAMKAYTSSRTPAKPKGFLANAADYFKSAATGLAEGLAPIADVMADASPLGMVKRAANLAGAAQGQPVTPQTGRSSVNPFSNAVAQHAYTPKTTTGEVLRTVGQNAPNFAAPAKTLAGRAVNVFAPAAGEEIGGRLAAGVGLGETGQTVARAVGGALGGVAGSIRPSTRPTPTPEDVTANIFAQRAEADPSAMRAAATDMRSRGVAPTVMDITGEKGRRLVRAVGVTSDDAGETLANNAARITSGTKPAVMAQTRNLGGDSRTAEQMARDVEAARSAEAQTKYAGPYAAPVELKDLNVIQALRDPEGLSAINRAIQGARARMDYKAVADLQALKATAQGPTGSGQVWPTTGRALDRVQIAFGAKGRVLAQNGANDIASGMYQRQSLINSLLDNVDGLKPARAAFRAKSQALDILTKPAARKDPFSTDPTDYGAWLKTLSPEARAANATAIRQDILDTLGGQRASTVGSVDELATSPYASQNLGQALGAKPAAAYISHLNARLKQRGNAQFVSPNGGSRTQVLANDTSKALNGAVQAADVARKVAGGDVIGLTAKAAAWLKTRGLSDHQARTLAEVAVDPSKTDAVIAAIERAGGHSMAVEFRNLIGRSAYPALGAAALSASSPAGQ